MNPFAAIWSVLVIAIVAMWLRMNGSLWADNVSPFNLLMFGWIGPLLIRGFNLSSLERPWSADVCWLVGWTTVALMTPCIISRGFPRFQQPSVQQTWQASVMTTLRNRRFRRIVLLTFAISFSAYIYNELLRNPVGIPLISLRNDPTLVGEAYQVWGKTRETRSLALYLYLPIHLQCAILYMIGRANSKRGGKWWILLSLLYPASTILKLSRTDLFQALVPLMMSEYYFGKFAATNSKSSFSVSRLVKRYPYVFASIALLVFGAFMLERDFDELRQGEGASELFQRAIGTDIHVGSQSLEGFLAQAYGYFGMPWENFADTYNSIRPELRLGVGAFRPLFALFGQGPALDNVLEQIGFDPANYFGAGHTGPLNTYPFITMLYLESGVVGIIAFPVVYAVFVNRIYANFRREPSFLNFCLYLQMPFAWMWLFSNAAFTALNFYLSMVFLLGLSWFYERFCSAPSRGLVPVAISRLPRPSESGA